MRNCKWMLLIGTFLSYFISPYLPVAWGWENNLLEWLQVAILGLGLTLNYSWWQEAKSANNPFNSRFLFWSMPLWLLATARELSWGRVFYPSGFDAINGPAFLRLTELPYGPFVYPFIAAIIVAWFYVIIKYTLYKTLYELLKEGRFPVTELLVTICAFVFAWLGEKKLHLPNMEEFNECLAYLGLILTAYCIKNALQKKTAY